LTGAGKRRSGGGGGVPSPCISVCTIDPATGLCAGCFRTVDEIAAWSGLTDPQKLAIWRHLQQRRDSARQG